MATANKFLHSSQVTASRKRRRVVLDDDEDEDAGLLVAGAHGHGIDAGTHVESTSQSLTDREAEGEDGSSSGVVSIPGGAEGSTLAFPSTARTGCTLPLRSLVPRARGVCSEQGRLGPPLSVTRPSLAALAVSTDYATCTSSSGGIIGVNLRPEDCCVGTWGVREGGAAQQDFVYPALARLFAAMASTDSMSEHLAHTHTASADSIGRTPTTSPSLPSVLSPTHFIIPVSDCAICKAPIDSDERAFLGGTLAFSGGGLAHKPACTHSDFHSSCLLRWAAVTNGCPVCKSRFGSIARFSLSLTSLDIITGSDSSAQIDSVSVLILSERITCDRVQTYVPSAEDLAALGYTQAELEAACGRCGTGEREHELLLCDGHCGTAMHASCIRYRSVPLHEWFCGGCIRNGTAPRGWQPEFGPLAGAASFIDLDGNEEMESVDESCGQSGSGPSLLGLKPKSKPGRRSLGEITDRGSGRMEKALALAPSSAGGLTRTFSSQQGGPGAGEGLGTGQGFQQRYADRRASLAAPGSLGRFGLSGAATGRGVGPTSRIPVPGSTRASVREAAREATVQSLLGIILPGIGQSRAMRMGQIARLSSRKGGEFSDRNSSFTGQGRRLGVGTGAGLLTNGVSNPHGASSALVNIADFESDWYGVEEGAAEGLDHQWGSSDSGRSHGQSGRAYTQTLQQTALPKAMSSPAHVSVPTARKSSLISLGQRSSGSVIAAVSVASAASAASGSARSTGALSCSSGIPVPVPTATFSTSFHGRPGMVDLDESEGETEIPTPSAQTQAHDAESKALAVLAPLRASSLSASKSGAESDMRAMVVALQPLLQASNGHAGASFLLTALKRKALLVLSVPTRVLWGRVFKGKYKHGDIEGMGASVEEEMRCLEALLQVLKRAPVQRSQLMELNEPTGVVSTDLFGTLQDIAAYNFTCKGEGEGGGEPAAALPRLASLAGQILRKWGSLAPHVLAPVHMTAEAGKKGARLRAQQQPASPASLHRTPGMRT